YADFRQPSGGGNSWRRRPPSAVLLRRTGLAGQSPAIKPAGRRHSQALQPLATAEAGVEVVPEFDIFLVLFPAEENLFAAQDGGKINQAALQILDENPAALKFGKNLLHVRERANPVVHRFAADVIPPLRQTAQAFVEAFQFPPQPVELLQPFANLRQKRARFVAGVMFVKTMFHHIYGQETDARSLQRLT